jgi:hypothetical protein
LLVVLSPGVPARAKAAAPAYGCEGQTAQQAPVTQSGYYVPFVTNGPPPGNPDQTGYLFDYRVALPYTWQSWQTVVYGPPLTSRSPIPTFTWVSLQGALCGDIFWERSWAPLSPHS